MIKKYIKYVVISLFFVLVISIVCKIEDTKNEQSEDFYLPSIELFTMDNKPFLLTDEVIQEKNIVLSFLSSDCIHCKFQAMDINNKSNLYKSFNHIVIIENNDSLSAFLEKTGLHSCSNYKLTFASYALIDQFNIKGFPSTLVFSSKGKFIKEIAGEKKVDNIILAINECLENK